MIVQFSAVFCVSHATRDTTASQNLRASITILRTSSSSAFYSKASWMKSDRTLAHDMLRYWDGYTVSIRPWSKNHSPMNSLSADVQQEQAPLNDVPAGSPSRGGDVTVYVLDLPTPFILFLCLFLSLWPFRLYFVP